MRLQLWRLPRFGLQMKPDEQQRMIGQVRADPRHAGTNRDAELAQMRPGADATAHQRCGRMDAAERKDDLAATEGLSFAAGADSDAGGAAAVKCDVGHR